MAISEEQIIAEAEKQFGPLEDRPGKLLAALETFYMCGMPNELSGDVDAPTGHFYRVERWIVCTDSAGTHELRAYESEGDACLAFTELEREFSAWEGE